MLSDGHDGGVVVWRLNLTDSDLEEIGEGTLHGNGTLVTNREDLLSSSAILCDVVTHTSDDVGVSTAAHTLIGSEGDDELFGFRGDRWGAISHVLIGGENHVDSIHTKALAIGKTIEIGLHL